MGFDEHQACHRAHRAGSAAGNDDDATAGIRRRVLTAHRLARHSSVCSLSRRAHADLRDAPATFCARTARADSCMTPNRPAVFDLLRGLATAQCAPARPANALTLHGASVIVSRPNTAVAPSSMTLASIRWLPLRARHSVPHVPGRYTSCERARADSSGSVQLVLSTVLAHGG